MNAFKSQTVSLTAGRDEIVELALLIHRGKVSGEFPNSLVKQFDKGRPLSEKQWYWVKKLIADANAPAPVVDASKAERIAPLQKLAAAGQLVGYQDFAASLLAQFAAKGFLSDKQWEWVDRIARESNAALDTVRIDENDAPKITKLANVAALLQFSSAVHVGAYRFTRSQRGGINIVLLFNRKWIGAANAQGYITHGVRLTEGDRLALRAIADLSLEELHQQIVHEGKASGICGICTRTLTDPESIENGIGPVCAAKIGFKPTRGKK